ncbi:MAG TPA: hypothetical protein VJ720_15885 [Chitinophaga sp.]|nr:hypothetical protein [Chitinophaga sp.]
MDSLFSNLFSALQSHITTAAPAIKGVYPELLQTENYKGAPAVWPCVFVDFTNFTFAELTQNVQDAAGELVFRLAYRVTAADNTTFIDTPTVLGYYEAERQLHQALQGWTNGSIAPLTRTKISTEDRVDRDWTFRVRIITYSLNFNEYPAATVTSAIEKPPLDLLT